MRVEIQCRDVWLTLLETETPTAGTWGSQGLGEDGTWGLGLLDVGSTLGSWNVRRLVRVILPGPA